MTIARKNLLPGAAVLGRVAAFAGVGVAGAVGVVILSTLIIGLRTGLPDWLVNTACYGASVVPVYLLHRRFSFGSEAPHRQALPRYVTVQAMALVLAAVFSFLAHEVLSLPTVLASIAVVGLVAAINFVVLRFWAFDDIRGRGSNSDPVR